MENSFDFNTEINDYSVSGIASEGLLLFFSENGFVPELLTALSNLSELPENTVDLIKACLKINPTLLPKSEVIIFLSLGKLSEINQENKDGIINDLNEQLAAESILNFNEVNEVPEVPEI